MITHFYDGIFGWFTFPKLYSCMVAKAKDGFRFVEIGSFFGRSSAYMAVEIANSGKQGGFYCVDQWKDANQVDVKFFYKDDCFFDFFTENMFSVKDYYTPIRKTSFEASSMFSERSLDFCFIDTSHAFEDTFIELVLWYPKIKSGGVIAGHDIDLDTVKRAVDKFFSSYEADKDENVWFVTV